MILTIARTRCKLKRTNRRHSADAICTRRYSERHQSSASARRAVPTRRSRAAADEAKQASYPGTGVLGKNIRSSCKAFPAAAPEAVLSKMIQTSRAWASSFTAEQRLESASREYGE